MQTVAESEALLASNWADLQCISSHHKCCVQKTSCTIPVPGQAYPPKLQCNILFLVNVRRKHACLLHSNCSGKPVITITIQIMKISASTYTNQSLLSPLLHSSYSNEIYCTYIKFKIAMVLGIIKSFQKINCFNTNTYFVSQSEATFTCGCGQPQVNMLQNHHLKLYRGPKFPNRN